MAPRSVEKAAGAAVAAVAAGWFVDHRYGVYRDIKGLIRNRKTRLQVEQAVASAVDHNSIYHLIERARPDAEALWFEGRTWTYAQLKLDIDKLVTILEQYNIAPGESVAVFTTNSPEMVIAFLALARLGAVSAMINTSLRSQTLSHCLGVAKAKLLICTPDLASAVLDLGAETSESTTFLSINLLSFPPLQLPADSNTSRITQIRYEDLAAVEPSSTPLPKRTVLDSGALIYTSGTSGKPKAVNIRNYAWAALGVPSATDRENLSRYYPLRTYSCLPLYHATCLLIGFTYCMGTSNTFCLARKFSAGNFSRDLVESRATRVLYVGELCRYLLRAPPSPYDKAHKVIVANGNGLAKDVWLKFQDRFNIPEIREFYRATEGVAKYDNFGNGRESAGYVGFEGPLRRWFEEDTFLVRYDSDTGKVWRDPSTGFCRVVDADEPGEAIGRIKNMDLYGNYVGNKAATEEKIIRDVFVKGDAYQRMGDLLVRDRRGWISFLDRTGDTYRWRGENVAAGEVREHISRLPEVTDCSVYAVKLAAYDGQAGAAGITLRPDVAEAKEGEQQFISELYDRLRQGGLTVWQMPRLLRVVDQIDVGATFKHAKEVLKKRSWDPSSVSASADAEEQDDSTKAVTSGNANGNRRGKDRLYWLNGEKFVPLEAQDWKEIESGKARL